MCDHRRIKTGPIKKCFPEPLSLGKSCFRDLFMACNAYFTIKIFVYELKVGSIMIVNDNILNLVLLEQKVISLCIHYLA